MNLLPATKVDALRQAIGDGLSQRAAARLVRVNRKTVRRLLAKFRWQAAYSEPEETLKTLVVTLTQEGFDILRREAIKQRLTPAHYASLLMQTIIEDELFAAITDHAA